MNERTERILDLLIVRSVTGLTEAEQDQLDALLLDVPERERDALDERLEAALAAAGNASALTASGRASAPGGLPAGLRERLEADADRFFGAAATPIADLAEARNRRSRAPEPETGAGSATPPRTRPGPLAWGGWAVAALLLLFVAFGRPPGVAPSEPAAARQALLAAEGTVQLPWAPPENEGFRAVRGDVSWNDERQQGYLRLVGMPANDPARAQYQLWIVDPDRDTEPVDGGVFDVPAGAEEVIVPIRAVLPVDEPAAFAITREQPGGVVVSEGPLLVVASRG